MTTLTSTVYLSTDSITNPPLYSANKANISWILDYDTIFHGHTGLCKVHINLMSHLNTVADITASWDGLIGTVRGSFQSIYSNNQSNLVLANLTPSPLVGSNTDYFYLSITEPNQSPVINIPTGKTQLNIQMLDTTETALITNMPNYGMMLFFEWISNDVINSNVPV